MSELNAIRSGEIYNIIEYEDCYRTDDLYYPKSEADKVIEDLEESHKKEVEQLLILNREQANAANRLRDSMEQTLRRQKYKRCLAMARWCKSEQTYSSFSIYVTEHPKSRWASRSVRVGAWFAFWKNRERRWLELAEKFKEAK